MSWVKGEPVRVFSGRTLAGLSDIAVDCREHNAVSVEVIVTGESPSATISVEGAVEEGGNYLPLVDPNASQAAVTASQIFDVVTGSAWARVRLADVSGTFGAGQGFTVTVTRFVSPGPSTITGTVQ